VSGDWLVSDALAPDPDDAVLAPLYAGAARVALTLPFCASCGQPMELDQQVCDGCLSVGATWRDVERRGVVHAATLVHRREPGLILVDEPYPGLDVELTSGHRIVMTTRLPANHLPDLGSTVTIGFRRVGATLVPSAEFPAADPPVSVTESSTEVSP